MNFRRCQIVSSKIKDIVYNWVVTKLKQEADMPSAEYYGRGYNSVANMPKDVVYRDFPEAQEGLNVTLDDSVAGIDGMIEANTKYLRSHLPKGKY